MRRIVGKWNSSRYVAVAVAGLVCALAVTGCEQSRLGAAAFYGSQRFSSVKLASEVANLNAAYQEYKKKIQISYAPADMPRQVLSWVLRFATYNQVADKEGIKVTPAQAQHEISIESSNVRQSGDTLPEAAVINGLPPDMLHQLGIWFSIEVQLNNKLDHGVAPKTAKGSAALAARVSHLECLAAKSLSIKVNPQYGVYDYASFMVVPAPKTLAAASPAPGATPSATPQLTPTC